ncbi:MAG: 6-phospho-beta-glucosidase [Anaerolineae bacterium]|nr:hypothetical protein [Caldilineales bacterium]MDW8318668.1 6-phospho-beta-glucosidase [Anaerolineae bacterium]
MKLTLIGGGGVRTPLFLMSLLRWHTRLGLTELCLMDVDARKLSVFAALSRALLAQAGDPFRLTHTTDARAALTGADYVVTAIRVGFERGRALDERIALKYNVLGQETTGPGGFAMALRSIPAVLEYARLMQEVCPDAWLFNFTNPAGLVAQALHEAGFERVVGICDGANAAQHAVAWWCGVPASQVRAEVYGLNHLSWCRHAWHGDEDLMPRCLADDGFLREAQGMFDPELVRMQGAFLNEYLYYYYYAERAVEAIQADRWTRGEEIELLNARLLAQLERVDIAAEPERALRIFFGYNRRRGETYMHYAHGAAAMPPIPETFDGDIPEEAGEGYAGVAFSAIEALAHDRPAWIGLNVPNRGALPGMAADDVVEVTCRVDGSGVHPLPVAAIPEGHLYLMRAVKRYERLTVQAIRERSRALAIEALMAHPLVLSYSRARGLVEDYLQAHAAYVGEWR